MDPRGLLLFAWAETFANTAQTEISYESLAGILEAFQAVYGLLRKQNKTHLDSFFVAHLPSDRQAETKKPEEIGSDDVRRAVSHTIRMLKAPQKSGRDRYLSPGIFTFSSMNWSSECREVERGAVAVLANPVAVVRARPLFPPRVAATRSELSGRNLDTAYHPPLPTFEEGEYRLEFVRSPSEGFSVWLSFQEDFPRFIRGRISKDFGVQDDPRTA